MNKNSFSQLQVTEIKRISVSLSISFTCILEYFFSVFAEVFLKYHITSKLNESQYLYYMATSCILVCICILQYFLKYLCPALPVTNQKYKCMKALPSIPCLRVSCNSHKIDADFSSGSNDTQDNPLVQTPSLSLSISHSFDHAHKKKLPAGTTVCYD